jgi:hypothetical protein
MYLFNRQILSLLIGACLLLTVKTVSAESPTHAEVPEWNKSTIINPNLGSSDPRGVVGQNGYKVFNAGAIAQVAVSSTEGNLVPDVYRSGNSDAWSYFNQDGGWGTWTHVGNHNSGSDLSESDIRANGRLKVTTDPNWRKLCNDNTSGNSAACITEFNDALPRTIYGETNHFFHTSGYSDSQFLTSDNG